jgi:tetratricopeptide (TPR) repeat protein
MKKPQLLLVLGGAIAVALIYFLGNRVPPAKSQVQPVAARDQGQQGGMQQQEVTPERWEVVQAKAIANLNTAEKAEVTKIAAGDAKDRFTKLSAWWKAKNQPYLATKYAAEQAKLENSEKSLTFAAQNFIALLNLEPDASVKAWLANESTSLLDTVLARNPNNTGAQIMNASCLVEASNNPMQGVQMLLGIVRADSNNLPATMTLGRFAMKSSQWPKAIARFEKVLRLQPKNAEALYLLAECYKQNGDVPKAKELFTEWKKIINNPQAAKDMDEYLKTF